MPDHSAAETIIQAADLRLAAGSLLTVLDYNGVQYSVPVFVIHDPIAFKTED